MSEPLKTILLVSASVVLILVLFLSGYLLGRVNSPFYHSPMASGRSWMQPAGIDCPHHQLDQMEWYGSDMPGDHYPGGGYFHHMHEQDWR